MRLKDLLFLIAFIAGIAGMSALVSIPVAICYNEPVTPFLLTALLFIISGLLIYRIPDKQPEIDISNRQSVILISIAWVLLILVGALPFFLSRSIASVTDVLFETVSGFTSTGSTILPNVEALPKSILFWRSLTHWVGGLTTIILLFAASTQLNIGGYELYLNRKKPADSLKKLVLTVGTIYITLTFLQTIFLLSGGMNLFESLCHSFGTVSTGSFSPKSNSISGYSSYLQYTTAIFMFLSGFSYLVYFRIMTRKPGKLFSNEENLTYILMLVMVSLLFTEVLHLKEGTDFWTSFRSGFFQSASFITSSGYYTTNYLSWPMHILPVVYLLLFVGGSTGSSSGGIKIARFLILIKNLKLQFQIPDLSRTKQAITYNKKPIGEGPNISILTFITVFGLLFVIGTIVLSLSGAKLETCVLLSISALSTFGSNIDLTSFPDMGKITMSLLMIAGRLEIYPLFLLMFPLFNRESTVNTK
jgi:trk system potassium uptake protein TrkH